MFTTKKTKLFKQPAKGSVVETDSKNPFVLAASKKSAETRSGNNALKYSTTGNDFLDQFSNLGIYRKPRKFEDISRDCEVLWAKDPLTAVKFMFFLRTISRKVQLIGGEKTEKVQKGGGLKHEAIMRMLWLNVNHREVFWNNVNIFISLGSWRDIFQMLSYDLQYNGWDDRLLDWNNFGDLIKAGLTNENCSNLVKKYLPSVKARSKCKTLRSQSRVMIGKWLVNTLGMTYRTYRLEKRSGTAHRWQQLISQNKMNKIDFDSIHGRALMQLVNSKFLKNQGLEDKYQKWIESKPIAKFTGYVHELAMKIAEIKKPYQKTTIDKQYDGLVELGKKDVNCKSGLIVVRDTSGSMGSPVPGQKISAGDVAKAMGIYFGDMLEGPFANSWIEFNRTAKMHTYKTKTFVEKWREHRGGYIGNTRFLSVIELFCNLKETIEEEHFPSGIICISDGEFDPGQLGKTNLQTAMRMLKNAGFSKEYRDKFQIVLWNIPNGYYGTPSVKLETYGEHGNAFYLSGYDPTILGFLLGGSTSEKVPTNAEELFEAAMDQECLNMVMV